MTSSILAQTPGNEERPTTREAIEGSRAVAYDHDAIVSGLSEAPREESVLRVDFSSKRITLPMPSERSTQGWLPVEFFVVRSDVMQSELALKYPEISSYLVQGVRDRRISGRIDLGASGFHAILHSPKGTVYMDPWAPGDKEQLLVYTRAEFYASTSKGPMACDVQHMGLGKLGLGGEGDVFDPSNAGRSMVGPPFGQTRRNYILALACSGEYGSFHGGNTSLVLSAMNTSINRVNSIVERELAIRLIIHNDSDQLIFLNSSTDPYTNNNGGAMLSQNQTTCDNIIGFNNYDIGHVFSTGGGGVAYLGCVCTSAKAGGVTGLSSPVGDTFDVDYVAHEMGHQFGCNHTFNNSCSGNRSNNAAYEPGSGSTIMSYAGICSPNLQNYAHEYYNNHSINEGSNYLHSGYGNNCSTQISSGNSAPNVTVPSGGFYIPIGTPFELTATGSDSDGDPITYSWEQHNLGPQTASSDPYLNLPSGNAPIFRSWEPTESATRVFPRLSDLLNNTTVVGEKLPTYTRDLTFRCTIRDNHPGTGGVDDATINFDATSVAGPFEITHPNTNEPLIGNTMLNVNWNVAGTDAAPVSCAKVNIYLSVDGGYTYPYVLAEEVDNTGMHDVILPAIVATSARVKVKAASSIFFDISNVNFSISSIAGCTDSEACNFMEEASFDDGSCTAPITLYADVDGDGYGNADVSQTGCAENLIGYVENATDCDDTRIDVWPGAPGTQEGVDNNCDLIIDGDELNSCTGDIDGNNAVDDNDILLVLGAFGCTTDCTVNVDGAPGVNVNDILTLLAAFGLPC
ncbi:MAG: M12 family metallo-peptidase [Flavobacteriales bacterium]|nr:M12 family metallo-peptidase [Flavobacteriales bacterium]